MPNTPSANSAIKANSQGTDLDTSMTSLDETFSSLGGGGGVGGDSRVKQDTDSIGTIKNVRKAQPQNRQQQQQQQYQPQPILVCNCVWSNNFKLHRLHQTLQKVHDPISSNSAPLGAAGASTSISQQHLLANTSGMLFNMYNIFTIKNVLIKY